MVAPLVVLLVVSAADHADDPTYIGPIPAPEQTAPPMGSSLRPGVQPPVVIKTVVPEYTRQARERGVRGKVTLSVRIGTDGHPRDISVLHSLEPSLDTEAGRFQHQFGFCSDDV